MKRSHMKAEYMLDKFAKENKVSKHCYNFIRYFLDKHTS